MTIPSKMRVTSAKTQGLETSKDRDRKRFSSGVSNWDLKMVTSFWSIRAEAEILLDRAKEILHQKWIVRDVFKQ